MPDHSMIAVLVLAAGGSSRMGVSKQLLPWGKTTLLAHCLATIIKLEHSHQFVVLGAEIRKIEKSIAHLPVTILNNESWERGLGNSISFGVNKIKYAPANYQGILVLLADQPLIDHAYLRSMISLFSDTNSIVASAYADGKIGVPALFGRHYFNELSELSGDGGARSVLQAYREEIRLHSEPEKLIDLDTAEEYEDLYQSIHQS